MDLFQLSAKIVLDISGFQQQLKQAARLAEDFDDEVEITLKVNDDDFDISDAKEAIEGISGTHTASIESDDSDFDLDDSIGDLEEIDEGAQAEISSDDSDFDVVETLGDLETINAGAEAVITADTSSADASLSSFIGSLDSLGNVGGFSTVMTGLNSMIELAEKAAEAMWNVMFSAAQAGDTIDKQSQMIGISSKAYQQWSYVLQRNGSDISVLRTVSRNFTSQMQNDEFMKGISSLGYTNHQFQSASTEQQFNMVVRGLINKRGTMNQIKWRSLASTLLGQRAYQELMPLLNAGLEGENGLDALLAFGGQNSMSDEAVGNSASLVDSLTALQTAWDGFYQTVLGENVYPVITGFINSLTGFVTGLSSVSQDARNWWTSIFGTTEGVDSVNAIGSQLSKDISTAEYQAARSQTLVSTMSGMASDMGALAESTSAWASALSELTTYYPELQKFMKENGLTWANNAEEIRDYIQAQKQLAIYEARLIALEKYKQAYAQQYQRVFQLEFAKEMALSNITGTVEKYSSMLGLSDYGFDMKNKSFTLFGDNYSPFGTTVSIGELSSMVSNAMRANGSTEQEIDAAVSQIKKLSEEFNEYNSSEKQLQDANKALELSETKLNSATTLVTSSMQALESSANSAADAMSNIGGVDGSRANGSNYIPFDGYRAKLHKGEAVLNRIDAERWRNGGMNSSSIDATATLNIGTYITNGKTDENSLVRALINEQKRQLRAVGEA